MRIPGMWHPEEVETTIDAQGRVVIPKALREQIGLVAGPVDIAVEGARIVLAPHADNPFTVTNGISVIPGEGVPLTDAQVRDLLESARR